MAVTLRYRKGHLKCCLLIAGKVCGASLVHPRIKGHRNFYFKIIHTAQISILLRFQNKKLVNFLSTQKYTHHHSKAKSLVKHLKILIKVIKVAKQTTQ